MQKKLLVSCFTLLSVFTTFTASAQFVQVNSPASIAGTKNFLAASFGADLTSGVFTADAVFINDGSANPTQGCDPAVNSAELAGKIALIDRGTCEFGTKALNAQNAGAIAVIILNNLTSFPDSIIVVGPGAVGASVTIPVVMLSYADGQLIRSTLQTESVNITIGNVQFSNDLRLTNTSIINFPNGTMPANQVETLGKSFTPGATVLNHGLEDASNVVLHAVITFTPAGGGASVQVYDETSNVLASLENDSTSLILLPAYTPIEGQGDYTITYSVSASVDDSPEVTNDNSVTSTFALTEDVYSKARWDHANNRPFVTNSYTISNGGNIEFLAGFEVAEGIGYKLDSIQFLVATNAASLGALEPNSLNAFVYEWDDADADGTVTTAELSVVGYAPVTIADTSATSEWITAEIYDYLELEPGGYIIPDDNKQYFVSVRYEGAQTVFFGFDEDYDQTVAVDNGIITSDIDLPYIGTTAVVNQVADVDGGFLFTGNRSSVAIALYINQFESPSIEVASTNLAVTLSPNPTNSQLVVESKLKSTTGHIAYTLSDNTGHTVYNSSKTLNSDYDNTSFDVSKFAAGQYFIVITTDNGIKAERFTVQH